MLKTQQVRCPNCGNFAHRQYIHQHNLVKTACPVCDYLLVSCYVTGKVIESYAPGIAV
ncbi:conserved hypothetical protein [Gloeothece citriformis PCC 7424]|uniref:Replication restart DNA helicase PriA n=1 Tax=Gloeothece citriformis (strain PCC 7424) TaxID=65393 RepID=B7K9T1_GLOC7|nr:hypothetical protein [Gloeothece citriformis]ACK70049.1 conserved hypothetical protein [Gloeothece citriformis PCC 7424]